LLFDERDLGSNLKMYWSAPVRGGRNFILWAVVASFLAPFACAAEVQLSNAELLIRISSADGSYTIGTKGSASPVLRDPDRSGS